MEQTANARTSAATIVGPTGVENAMDASMPPAAQTTEMTAATTVTPLKLRHTLIADSAGKIISADIRSEPTRFIASTIITAMTVATRRL